MKSFQSRAIAALAALLVALSPLVAVAAEHKDGATVTGSAYGQPGAGFTGSTFKVLRSDASGILRTTEEYPEQLQNDRFVASDTTNTVINGVLRPLGLGWSVSPFGSRTVLLTRVQKGTANTLKLYLFGSDDNVNYFPILSQDVWSYTNNDSTKIDTLMATIPTQFSGSNSVRQFKIVLPEAVYPGRYLQIWATRTDSAYASNAMHLGLTYEGRWK